MSNTRFKFDVVLSYSRADATLMGYLANRLKRDGMNVHFAGSRMRPDGVGIDLPDEVLDTARVMVLGLSRNSSSKEWSFLESGTFRFRDPSNQERRFIPVRLDDSSIPDELQKFAVVDYSDGSNTQYHRLLAACQPPPPPPPTVDASDILQYRSEIANVASFAMTLDGTRIATGFQDGKVQLIDAATNNILKTFRVHEEKVSTIVFDVDCSILASGGIDGRFCAWNAHSFETLACWNGLEGHLQFVGATSYGLSVISASHNGKVCIYDLQTGDLLHKFQHNAAIFSVTASPQGKQLYCCKSDGTIHIWDLPLPTPSSRIWPVHNGPVTIQWGAADRLKRPANSR